MTEAGTPSAKETRWVRDSLATAATGLRRARRIGAWFAGVALLGLLLVGAGTGLVAWTDHEWFASIGEDAVFWTQYLSIAATWLAFTLANGVVLLVVSRNAWHVVGAAGRFRAGTALAAFVAAGWMGSSMAANWMVFRLAVAQSPFGRNDPLFGLDAGFFVFTLPALEQLVGWAFQLVLLALVVFLTIVLISSRLDYTGQVRADWKAVRRVTWRLGAVLMVVSAASFVLRIWQLDYSTSRTSFAGASTTDVHAVLPGLVATALACLGVGVVLLIDAGRVTPKATLVGFAGLLLVAILGQVVVPAAVQRYWATPNEEHVELKYLSNNIAMTRDAYQLDQVAEDAYPGGAQVDAADGPAVESALAGAPMWTSDTVSQAFTQLQAIRPYYRMSAISQDRYRIDGRLQQVLVAARELSTAGLPSAGNTWVNRRLVYTHGYGLAISSASQTTADGFPKFLEGDIPTKVDAGPGDTSSLTINQPRIYFAPDQTDWVAVGTSLDEFDYATGTRNATNRYAGGDGVRLGGPLNRLAWALRLKSVDLLLSDYLNPDSRLLLNRGVVARATKVAPWLTYDTPYPAVVDGRVTWIMAAYTTSDHYPYAQALPNSSPLPNGTDYVRSSVKVTVDAETGKTTFYPLGDDPIRDAWARIFPSVLSDEPLPAAVAAHAKVPAKLFTAQEIVFSKYHVSDPHVFYSQEDLWRIPADAKGKAISPQYVLLDPGASGSQGLYLVQPYALPGRDVLAGWLTAASEPGSNGQRTVYSLPKSRVTLGASQVTARINQDPAIAQQLTLWNQPGSTVGFGSMLLLPIKNSTVYLQPVFLRAQKGAITELAGVIAVNGTKVCLGTSLADALQKAFG